MGRYIKLASQLETVNFSNVNAGNTLTAVNADFNNIFINGSPLTSSGATSLASLSDVSLSSLLNGQSLLYNSTSSKWVNGTPAGFSSASFATTGSNTFIGNQIITGSISATSDITAFSTSDKQLKDNITLIPNSLEKITKIGGYTFDWNNKQDIYEVGSHDIGVIAQELEEILPEVVITRDNGYKAVKYEKIIPLLIEAIKELKAEVDDLKSKVK
jgi:hypothetical protein